MKGNTVAVKKQSKTNWKNILFCCLVLAFPLIQFAVFYIGVNFNSIFLSLKNYDYETGAYSFAGFDNFKMVVYNFKELYVLKKSLGNSIILICCSIFIGMTLSVHFSFFIHKKVFGYKTYKVVLFLPNIVSMIVMVLVFKYFVESALPDILEKITHKKQEGLLANPDTTFGVLIFFSVWVGFGVQMLMFSGAMSGIDESVIEAAQLDGVSFFQELYLIVFPLIFPTVITFITVGVAAIFTNQMNLYSFYGSKAPNDVSTLGYYFYKQTLSASIGEYPYLAAFGIVMSCFSIPVTIAVRKLLEKVGEKF